MNLLQKKQDLLARGLDSSGPGQYCSVEQSGHRATVNVRAAYMEYGQITVDMFQDEGIIIRNGRIDQYRALYRRILYFFYNLVVHDDDVVCVVQMQ